MLCSQGDSAEAFRQQDAKHRRGGRKGGKVDRARWEGGREGREVKGGRHHRKAIEQIDEVVSTSQQTSGPVAVRESRVWLSWKGTCGDLKLSVVDM